MRVGVGAILLTALGGAGTVLGASAAGSAEPLAVTLRAERADTLAFRHESHGSLDCETCHRTGSATVRGGVACADCHHDAVPYSECARCHSPGGIRPGPEAVGQEFELSVGEATTRTLTFDHGPHFTLDCDECHGTAGRVGVARGCETCHDEHHRPSADCWACHELPREEAHRIEPHRATCAASGCHSEWAVEYGEGMDTRELCLICHGDRRDHEPGFVCANCHLVKVEGPRVTRAEGAR